MTGYELYLSGVAEWVWRVGLQGSVLVLLILGMQQLWRRKLSPRWIYGFWVLLLVRLVMPWAPESPISIYNLMPSFEPDRSNPVLESTEQAKTDLSIESPDNFFAAGDLPYDSYVKDYGVGTNSIWVTDIEGAEIKSLGAAGNYGVGESSGSPEDQGQSGWSMPVDALPVIWLFGVMGLLGYIAVSNYRFWREVKQKEPVTDGPTLDILERCKRAMGVHRYLPVVISDKVKSPVLFGFVRPRLLLPAGIFETLSHRQMHYVFMHELAHLKRFDIGIGWLMTLLQALHWYNPLIWWAFFRMRSDRELACDSLALSRMQGGEARHYGHTIVRLLEYFSWRQRLPGMAGILENKTLVRRRIVMIAQGQKNSKVQMVLAVGMMLVLAGMVLTDAQGQVAERTADVSAAAASLPEKAEPAVREAPMVPEKLVSQSSEAAGKRKSLLERIIAQQQVQIHAIEVRYNDLISECGELIKENRFDEILSKTKSMSSEIEDNKKLLGAKRYNLMAGEIKALHEQIMDQRAKTRQKQELDRQQAEHEQQLERERELAAQQAETVRQLYELALDFSTKRDHANTIATLKLLLTVDPEDKSAQVMLQLTEELMKAERQAALGNSLSSRPAQKPGTPEAPALTPVSFNPKNGPGIGARNDDIKNMFTPEEWARMQLSEGFLRTKMDRTLVELKYNGETLESILLDLESQSQIEIEPIWDTLEFHSRLDRNKPITIEIVQKIPLSKALELVLEKVSGTAIAEHTDRTAVLGQDSEIPVDKSPAYTANNGVVTISSKNTLKEKHYTRIYDISDFIGSSSQMQGMGMQGMGMQGMGMPGMGMPGMMRQGQGMPGGMNMPGMNPGIFMNLGAGRPGINVGPMLPGQNPGQPGRPIGGTGYPVGGGGGYPIRN
ncbi:MAG: hypothetical protein GY869_13165 [Planctomycetes bacterium]|nr:hypothetical protein [Planctomycetota bacterium]